nr:hypothetical protein [Myxococcota bacterium]
MTKPAGPDERVVEMDAMDEAEWERDIHTPQASDGQLQGLVRQMASTPAAAVPVVAEPAVDSAKAPTFAKTLARPRPPSPAPPSGVPARPATGPV